MKKRVFDFLGGRENFAGRSSTVATLTNLTTKARLRDLEEAGFGIAELLFVDTPKSWPQSGFQIVAAHLKKGYRGHWRVAQLGTEAQSA